jgi:hypothetical protein
MDKYFEKRNIISAYENNKKIKITYSEINEIMKKKLWKTPLCQVDLNEDRISEISNTWKSKKYFYLIERPLLIAFIKVGTDIEYWLVDGQHKLNAALELFKNDKDNGSLECAFIECVSKEEMCELFNLVNKDSVKAKLYIDSDIFTRKVISELKDTMREKYNNLYREKTKNDSNVMTLDEFLKEVTELGMFADWQNNEIKSHTEFIKDLEKCNKMFWNDAKYSETTDRIDKNDIYHTDELNILNKEEKNCMFLKNNNFREYFVNYLEDNDIKPYHDYKNVRGKISIKLRKDVWKKQFKIKKIGKCPVYQCKNIIGVDKFECGHVISVKNGGDTTLENLLPICHDCNQKMKSQNIDEYEKELIYTKLKNKCFYCKKNTDLKNMLRNSDNLYCGKCYEKVLNTSDSDDNSEDESLKKINKKK